MKISLTSLLSFLTLSTMKRGRTPSSLGRGARLGRVLAASRLCLVLAASWLLLGCFLDASWMLLGCFLDASWLRLQCLLERFLDASWNGSWNAFWPSPHVIGGLGKHCCSLRTTVPAKQCVLATATYTSMAEVSARIFCVRFTFFISCHER